MRHLRTLGKVSANLISKLYDENKAIFNISDVQRISSKSYNESTDLLSELVTRRVIARLKSGKFLIVPQELGSTQQYIGNWYVAAREVINSPHYYIGFYSAMHYWGMLTQPLVKIFVVTPQRQIVPKEMKDKMIFVYSDRKFFWGISSQWVTKTEKARISDLEKTVVDILAHPDYCGGITDIVKGIWIVKDKIDYSKLVKYIQKYNKNVVAKRLGYILEILEIDKTDSIKKLRKFVKKRYDLFDPTLSYKNLSRNHWHLVDNIGKRQILDIIWH